MHPRITCLCLSYPKVRLLYHTPLGSDHSNHPPTASMVQPAPSTHAPVNQQSKPIQNKKQTDALQSARHPKPPPPPRTPPPTPEPIAGNAAAIKEVRTTSVNEQTDMSGPGETNDSADGGLYAVSLLHKTG